MQGNLILLMSHQTKYVITHLWSCPCYPLLVFIVFSAEGTENYTKEHIPHREFNFFRITYCAVSSRRKREAHCFGANRGTLPPGGTHYFLHSCLPYFIRNVSSLGFSSPSTFHVCFKFCIYLLKVEKSPV